MQRTAFYQLHVDHGAKFVDFAGWEMPIMYRSIIEEHRQVRESGGLFDVSHMGRLKITGRNARRLIERVCTRRVSDMKVNTCRYSLVCNEQGGILDDILIYRFDEHWMLVVNASNRQKICAHLAEQAADMSVKVDDQTESTAMVALQGPKVMEHVGRFSKEVPTLKRYTFCIKNLLVLKMTISRTGYTGEDGVEVILPSAMAGMAIKLLMKQGDGDSAVLQPCGLGARDTLRLEAGMPLYGHELDETIDPITADLAWAVNLDKDQDERGEKFVGQDAIAKIAAEGPARKRVGLRFQGRRTPRQGMMISREGKQVGIITSGALSPTLGYPIAMAYVDTSHAEVGTEFNVTIGSQNVAAQVVPLPFYKRAK